MATLTSERAEPVNRIADLLPPSGKKARRLELSLANAEPEPQATWTALAAGVLALLSTFLWPAFLVVTVLLLVLLTPFFVLGRGVMAIRRHAHRST
jgi:hypothetical protein